MQFVTASETAVLISDNSSIRGSKRIANDATADLEKLSFTDLDGKDIFISLIIFIFTSPDSYDFVEP